MRILRLDDLEMNVLKARFMMKLELLERSTVKLHLLP